MMKMMMKIDKTQVDRLVRVVSGQTGTFRRTPAIQAGYKVFEAMAIGGAGGRNYGTTNAYYGSGGGGGGAIRVQALIKDLPEQTFYYAGVKGADGDWSAGGWDGQNSGFGPWVGYGGQGARVISPGWGTSDVYASVGGKGGGNSFNAGYGGNGGYPPFKWGGLSYGLTQAETGSWGDLGGGNGGGGGGGGGGGASGRAGYSAGATAGAWGNYPNAAGPWSDVAAGAFGGMGGGANLVSVTGVTEYYGCGNDGAVAYRLS
jgi:hypothetical protein